VTPKRPHRLRWVGAMFPDGRPARHLGPYGLEARDYDADETDALSAEQIAIARANPDLYTLVDAPSKSKTTSKKASTTQPQAATGTNEPATADDAESAATPATEG
jgi:hypothetical protein